MCKCKFCEKEFNKRKNKSCNTCGSCETTKRRWESRKQLIEMLGGKCIRCGFSGNPASLQFHHTNPADKKYALYSRNLLKADRYEEVKKCVLLCANCHIEEHTNKELLKKLGVIP